MKIPQIHIPDFLGQLFAGGRERFWYLSPFKSMFAVKSVAVPTLVYYNAPNVFADLYAGKPSECGPFDVGCLKDKKTGKIVFGVKSGNGYLVFAVPGHIKLSRSAECDEKSFRTTTGCWKLDPSGEYDLAYDLNRIAPGFKPVPYTTAWPLIVGLLTTVGLSELVFLALSRSNQK